MKVLALGMNPSTRVKNSKHFDSDSGPDKLLNETLSHRFSSENYIIYDVIEKRMKNKEFKALTKTQLLSLCRENEAKIMEKIRTFKPELILQLFVSHRVLAEFVEGLKDKYTDFPRIVKVYQPSYVNRWKKSWGVKGYIKHIEEKINIK